MCILGIGGIEEWLTEQTWYLSNIAWQFSHIVPTILPYVLTWKYLFDLAPSAQSLSFQPSRAEHLCPTFQGSSACLHRDWSLWKHMIQATLSIWDGHGYSRSSLTHTFAWFVVACSTCSGFATRPVEPRTIGELMIPSLRWLQNNQGEHRRVSKRERKHVLVHSDWT